jgi:Rrf2 family protein
MRVSSRGEYGLRALIDLTQHYGQGPVTSADIARRQMIPLNYLNQLLLILRNAGLIRSTRGPGGGHELARPPESITMGEVLDVLEGPRSPASCVNTKNPAECDLADQCALRPVWDQIRLETERILESRTLLDLVQKDPPEGVRRVA